MEIPMEPKENCAASELKKPFEGAHPVKEDRVIFVSADVQSISLKLEVDGGVVVADVGHVLDARNLLRRDVSVLHRDQRDVDANL